MALHEIDADLRTAETTLSLWEKKYPEVAKAAVTANVEFELAWADAIDAITKAVPEGSKVPTVAVMEAEATRMCANQIKAKKFTEADLEIAKRLIGITETTLSSVQTRVGLVRIEAGLSGMKI